MQSTCEHHTKRAHIGTISGRASQGPPGRALVRCQSQPSKSHKAGWEPPHLQEGLEHGVAEALHGGEVVRQQAVDEARVDSLGPWPHAHGALQHPCAAQARVVAIHRPQRAPVQRIRLGSAPRQRLPLDMHCMHAF
jgi:hypothetical protein